jgi:hypothetical protein
MTKATHGFSPSSRMNSSYLFGAFMEWLLAYTEVRKRVITNAAEVADHKQN